MDQTTTAKLCLLVADTLDFLSIGLRTIVKEASEATAKLDQSASTTEPDKSHGIDAEYVYDSSQVAVILGVQLTTLAEWRRVKKGPSFYQFGGKRSACKYKGSDLIKFVEESRTEAVT